MRRLTTALAAFLTSTAMLGTVATVGLVLDPAVAEANNGNGNGGGNGNGNGRSEERGNNGNNGNRGERGNSAQARAGNGNGRGAIASELKNLNAFCANENAFANASDDSNIGQIRAYQTASANVAQYEGAISGALGGRDVTDENVAALAASYDQAITTLQEQIANAEPTVVENADGTQTVIPADTTELEAQLAAYISSRDTVTRYQEADSQRDTALSVATRGRTLSPEAQAYLDAGCQR